MIAAARSRWAGLPGRYPPLPAVATTFLGSAEDAARRSSRRPRVVIAGLAALTVAAGTAAGLAAHNAATAARQHAIALSRQLAADGITISATSPDTTRRLAVAAWGVFPTSQAQSLLTSLLVHQQQTGSLPADPASVNGVAFSPDGKLLASADSNGTVRFWNPAAGQPAGASLRPDPGVFGGVRGIAFSPDGRHFNPLIKANRRSGERVPPLTAKTSRHNFKEHGHRDRRPEQNHLQPGELLPCGATVWVETGALVTITEVDGNGG